MKKKKGKIIPVKAVWLDTGEGRILFQTKKDVLKLIFETDTSGALSGYRFEQVLPPKKLTR
jgi:hypothetical protein